jgi:hypothetical protein
VSPAYLPEHVPAFVRALEIAEREARALEASWNGLNQMDLGVEQLDQLEPDASLAISIEAFAARFGRLQDHLGEKLIPRLLLLLGEVPGPLLDNLNRAERLGILENALDGLTWRKLATGWCMNISRKRPLLRRPFSRHSMPRPYC